MALGEGAGAAHGDAKGLRHTAPRAAAKDVQRAIFQPVILASGIVTIASFGVAGVITMETVKLWALAAPVMLAGAWVGLQLYGKLDEVAFRKVVLWLLLFSGVSLVVPSIMSAGELAHAMGAR